MFVVDLMVNRQVTVVLSDNANSKGSTTSSRGNELSDNNPDASDSDDVELSVNIDSTILKKSIQRISEKMEQGENDTIGLITHCINFSVKTCLMALLYWVALRGSGISVQTSS